MTTMSQEATYGQGTFRFRLQREWGRLDPAKVPVNDCHEMVQDRSGRIFLLTNEIRNNVLIYDKSGRLLDTWGHEYPGAHGLTLSDENGAEFLYITDTETHLVHKTTLEGRRILTIDHPAEIDAYREASDFVPTETAVAPNGDIFVADGYGKQYLLRYDSRGKLVSYFGGIGDRPEHLENAHGVAIDTRAGAPTLLVTDRLRHCFKRFTFEGQLLEVISLPGACVCRPVIKGDYLYSAVIWSPNPQAVGSGFITILDRTNRVISNIGGTEPVYRDGVLQPMAQAQPIFHHPHDVLVDDEGNLYVPQWNSGKVYPDKLIPA